MWSSGFLLAVYQRTLLRPGSTPILHLKPQAGVTPEPQRRTLDLLQAMNEMYTGDTDTELAARIASYELAFRMQATAPEAVDISREPEHIKQLYGLDRKHTAEFGSRCLLAAPGRACVRFVQLFRAAVLSRFNGMRTRI